jgi:hypothetical protein
MPFAGRTPLSAGWFIIPATGSPAARMAGHRSQAAR